MIKTCGICGKQFNASTSKTQYCSDECRGVANQNSKIKWLESQKVHHEPRKCKVCGKEFSPRSITSIYCSDECRINAKKVLDAKRHAAGSSKHNDIICPVCGKQFTPNHGLQKYCSDECRSIIKNADRRNSYVPRLSDKTCLVCGKHFTSPTLTKYCSKECQYKATLMRNNLYRRRKPKMTKICPHCGKSFIANRQHRIYCSTECYLVAWRRKPKPITTKICKTCGKPFTPNSHHSQLYCSPACRTKHAYKGYKPSHPPRDKTCLVCGKHFTTTKGNKKYCSPECMRAAQAELKRRFRQLNPPEPVEKVCGVCGKTFTRLSPGQKYCSPECALIAEHDARAVWRNAHPVPHKPRLTKTCPICGNEFAAYGKQIFCADCRIKRKRQINSAYKKRHHAKPTLRVCGICGNQFYATGTRKYCSDKCSIVATAQRQERARRLSAWLGLPDRICPVCGNFFSPISTTQKYCSKDCAAKVEKSLHCAECGKEFIPIRVNQKFCSDICRRAYRRKHAAHATKMDLIRKCVVCGENFTTHHGNQKFCSDTCKNLAEQQNSIHDDAVLNKLLDVVLGG